MSFPVVCTGIQLTPCRTFVTAWQSALRIHEQMADNRLRFSQRLNEMSQELSTLAKEVDQNRKQVGFLNTSPCSLPDCE